MHDEQRYHGQSHYFNRCLRTHYVYISIYTRNTISCLVSDPSPPQMGMGHSPDLGPPYLESVTGLDGKDPPLLRQTQTGAYRDRDQWSRRVAGLLKASETCLGCPRGTTAAAAAIAETKKRQRRERLRARQSVMIQMYNNNRHADLDSSLASLRRSFHRCSTVSRVIGIYGVKNAHAMLRCRSRLNVIQHTPKSCCCYGHRRHRTVKQRRCVCATRDRIYYSLLRVSFKRGRPLQNLRPCGPQRLNM